MNRYICVHGHFYQPPRENPWLERIELQDSANPFHDWNERITAECYAPNARSRLLGPNGKVRDIVSNYSRMSYNFGPTLMAWMERHATSAYNDIIASNEESKKRFGGHPSAIAQVYNHMIMPLANRRDKQTQVRWGIRDYEKRFGNSPEGIWLAETAVDIETLEVLAEAGIKYTILSQYQAKRHRKLKSSDWHDAVGGRIDPSHPYIQKLPSGKEINIFFYDGPISRGIAFEGLLKDGKKFADRLMSAFVDSRKHTQVVNIATDGETYGHHHQFGEMALSYALDYIESAKLAKITNYGQFLELFPPQSEVEILENTSWSCSHGIERWRANCGCNSGGKPGWNQEWRGPLRHAFDFLRDTLAPHYEQRMAQYLKDPWEARDAYIEIILDRSREQIDRFFSTRAIKQLTPAEKSSALKLLELQRHAMLMYTSCGWFFDELSGIETVQCLQYAGRVVQLAHEEMDNLKTLENDFLRLLTRTKGNTTTFPDGQALYRSAVKPAMIDFLKVAAHHAVASIFEPSQQEADLYSYRIVQDDIRFLEAGKTSLVLGKARITSQITLEHAEVEFGALHFGDHAINAGVRHHVCDESYQVLLNEVLDSFNKMDFTSIIRLFDKHFPSSTFSLKSLFRDEQRRILNTLLTETSHDLSGIYNKIYQDHYTLMRFLVETGNPLPHSFTAITNFVIDSRLRSILSANDLDSARLEQTLEDGNRWHFLLEEKEFSHLFRSRAENISAQFSQKPHSLEILSQLEEFVGIIGTLPFQVNLWRVQNDFFQLTKDAFPTLSKQGGSEEYSADAWLALFQTLGNHLSISLPA